MSLVASRIVQRLQDIVPGTMQDREWLNLTSKADAGALLPSKTRRDVRRSCLFEISYELSENFQESSLGLIQNVHQGVPLCEASRGKLISSQSSDPVRSISRPLRTGSVAMPAKILMTTQTPMRLKE